MRLAFIPSAIALCLMSSTGAAAQLAPDSSDALVPGRRALAFTLPNGGGAGFGLWRVTAPDRARGFFVNLNLQWSHSGADGFSGTGSEVSLAAGPQRRHYAKIAGPVVPFVQSGLTLGGSYRWNTSTGPTPQSGGTGHSVSGNLGAQLALGAEWFAFRRVSLEAHTGIGAGIGVSRGKNSPGGQPPQPASTSWGANVNTFASAFSLQLYF